ncbi:DUF3221 domain-containing protein [[Clostridium] dakarense]|uniref:DUF3221 domain-containing protein n=1 Tax=Faecalimicrobium dakarense TaxID=1301100 RepID=UPI0004B259D8|nr:DUF3221 domain-containing protein [[Clostridium] dakarense]
MKKLLMLISIISLFTVGCTSNNSNEKGKIDIRGKVTSINIDGDNSTILVEGKLEDDTNYDEAYITITKDTKIQKYDMDDSFNSSELELGFIVEVIFEGPVKETSPAQGTAKVLKIISE